MSAQKTALPNICWLIPDSVRAIPAPDLIGRFEFMDRFAEQSVEYTRMYTAAPSTMMSAASYFTGIPPVFITETYSVLKDHRLAVPTVYTDLARLGYHLYFFSFYPHLREAHAVFGDVEKHVEDRGAFEEHYVHAADGDPLREYVETFLATHELKEPFCFFYHAFVTNALFRDGYDFSADIERVYTRLSSQLPPDRSVVVMHSDHGFPMYRGEADMEFMWEHDLVMTEENIRVPFFIRYPGCSAGTKVQDTCSLIDIYATLMDLAGSTPSSPFNQGRSIVGAARAEDRVVRVDNRMHTQGRRRTALVSGSSKLVVDYETMSATVWRIEDGCVELPDMQPPPEQLARLARELDRTERLSREAQGAIASLTRFEGAAALQRFLDSDRMPVVLLFCASPDTARGLKDLLQSMPFSAVGILRSESAVLLKDLWPHCVAVEDLTLRTPSRARYALCVDAVTCIEDAVLGVFDLLGDQADNAMLVFDRLMSHELVSDPARYCRRKRMVAELRKKRDARRAQTNREQRDEYLRKLAKAYRGHVC